MENQLDEFMDKLMNAQLDEVTRKLMTAADQKTVLQSQIVESGRIVKGLAEKILTAVDKVMNAQLEEVTNILISALDQNVVLQSQIVDSGRMVNDLEENIGTSVELLLNFKQEHDSLKLERDEAVREAEEMRKRREEEASELFIKFENMVNLEGERDRLLLEEDEELMRERREEEASEIFANFVEERESLLQVEVVSLKEERDRLQLERDSAVAEVEGIREREEELREVPSYFLCPILQETMRDPQVAADGFTYEAEALNGWLDSGHNTSPMTNLELEHRNLTPNRSLRSAIEEFLQRNNS
ncbi:hypothetical protein IFM89_024886 [Coptis chinensis]|uniref:U-box domain-containing protein n=1 Tax=Coptis chinensis TaxID=261450 RepID=A0A835H8W1_9MAGN|nr:hypothetical protein IFM89_024886 [Coptis chinensis]